MRKIRPLIIIFFTTLQICGNAIAGFRPNPLRSFTRPEVIFTFDDVYKSVYDHALPILNEVNIQGTVYVAIKWANDNDPAYMKWNDLTEIDKKYGWEIAAHSLNHLILENESEDVVEAEVKGCKDAFEAHGFHPVSFAVPFGSYNNTVLTVIQKYFESNRGFWTGDPFALDELRNWLNLSIKQVANTTKVEEIKNWIDRAIGESKTLILVFHKIETQNPALDQWGFSTEQLREITQYVASKRNAGLLDVPTIKQSLANKGMPIQFESAPKSVRMDLTKDIGKWFVSPTFQTRPQKAYLIKIKGNAKDFDIKSRYQLMIEETFKNGSRNLVPFLTSEPESLILAKTYIPSSDNVVKARLKWKIKIGGPGIMNWETFEIFERSKVK